MMVVGLLLGALGLVNLIYRNSLLGMLVGLQLMIMGSCSVFVLAITGGEGQMTSHIVTLFLVLAGIAQLLVGYSLATRLYFLKRKIGVEGIKGLKN